MHNLSRLEICSYTMNKFFIFYISKTSSLAVFSDLDR